MNKYPVARIYLILLIALIRPLGATSTGDFSIFAPLSEEQLHAKIQASYGFLSHREPTLDEGEYAIVEQFIPFLDDDPDFALEMIEGLTENNLNLSASFDFVLGNLYFQAKREEKALMSYTKAIQKYPDYLRAWRSLGWLLLYKGDLSGALEAFGKSVKLGDTDPDTFGQIGYCFYAQKDYISSLSAYTQALLYEPNGRSWMEGKLASMIALGNFDSARVILESLTRQFPEDRKFWQVLANTYTRLDQFERASAVLEYLIDIGTPDQEELMMLSNLYMKMGSYPLAASVQKKMIHAKIFPKTADVLSCASKLLDGGYTVEAQDLMDAYNSSSDDFDQDEQLTLYLYNAKLAEIEGEVGRARELLLKAHELEPTNGDVLVRLGISQHQNEDSELALITLSSAELYPASRLNALLAQAQVYIHLEAFEYAAEKLEIAINEGAGESAQKLYQDCLLASRKRELDQISTQLTIN
ncbi:MAG: tetratricopeptide repeat protein [Opitutales bacterium]|nr:tetratricopeptide repeat protein [Opitutales bacterium]